MRITTKQANALNLMTQKARALIPRREYDSKLEERYAWRLELEKTGGRIRDHMHHPFRLRLGKGVTYQPDFLIVRLDGVIELHEVKGPYCRDKGRVKYNAAAERFPWFQFVFVTCSKGDWKTERYWKEEG